MSHVVDFIAGLAVGVLCAFGALGFAAAILLALCRSAIGEALWR